MFSLQMNNELSISNLNTVAETLSHNVNMITNNDVEKCVNDINDVLLNAAKPFLIIPKTPYTSQSSCKTKHVWYDDDCNDKKIAFDAAKSLYYHTQSSDDLRQVCVVRNSYRKLCRKKKK